MKEEDEDPPRSGGAPYNDCLPDELLLNIMSRLNARDLGRARQVCRSWSRVAGTAELFVNILPVQWSNGLCSTHQGIARVAVYSEGSEGIARVAVGISEGVAVGIARVAVGIARVAVGIPRVAVGIARVAVGIARVAVGVLARVAVGIARVAVGIARVAVGIARVAVGIARVAGV